MKKNVYLGVNEAKSKCCILQSLANFDKLSEEVNDISEDDFIHSSTDWSGCDDIQRTLDIEGYKLTNRVLKLPKKIIFEGEDYDHGHTYDWKFGVSYIYEVENK